MTRSGLGTAAVVTLAIVTAAACERLPEERPKPALAAGLADPTSRRAVGDPRRGRRAIERYGCGACHMVPGVPGAEGLVGPPLLRFGSRGVIAGRLANTPENLVRWILDPPGVDPETDMPDLGVSALEAEDIAAYLHALE